MLYLITVIAMMGFSVLAVTTRKILRAATFLLFALFSTAVVYFMLDYQFLGAVQIAVYAGGIVVLVVFAILLTSHPADNTKALTSRRRVRGFIGAAAAVIVCVWALASRVEMLTTASDTTNPDMKEIGYTMMSSNHGGYLLPFEAISVLLLACIIGGIVVARKKDE